jgi:GT2 family glycosyltransferase
MKNPVRFFAVIALYQRSPRNSASFETLQLAASHLSQEKGDLHILLYDNTPGGQPMPLLPPNTQYHTTGRNDGLGDAFNLGLEMARRQGRDWLITLDQDTALPPHFLGRVAEVAAELDKDTSIAAIVPQVVGGGRVLSPKWFWAGAIPRWFLPGFVGVSEHATFAFNSASTLRPSALHEIGGYSPWFWLDNSDSVLYHQLHLFGRRVFVAGDIQVNHDFSMLDKEKKMDIARYHDLLMSESAFWDLAMNPLAGLERTVRLAARWCRHMLRGGDPAFRVETAKALKRRLFYSRESRIKLWKREVESSRPFLKGTDEDFFLLQKRLSMRDRLERSTPVA